MSFYTPADPRFYWKPEQWLENRDQGHFGDWILCDVEPCQLFGEALGER